MRENCILLVEDYVPNILVATAILQHLGYDYDVAHNGQEALCKLKDNLYAAVLMDVQMPEMDGFETTAKFRAQAQALRQPYTPVIGLTAHALKGDREKCIEAGMDDYIAKPYGADDLDKKLGNVLLQRSA